jgi:predicted ArsR family transcriptional regulator
MARRVVTRTHEPELTADTAKLFTALPRSHSFGKSRLFEIAEQLGMSRQGASGRLHWLIANELVEETMVRDGLGNPSHWEWKVVEKKARRR